MSILQGTRQKGGNHFVDSRTRQRVDRPEPVVDDRFKGTPEPGPMLFLVEMARIQGGESRLQEGMGDLIRSRLTRWGASGEGINSVGFDHGHRHRTGNGVHPARRSHDVLRGHVLYRDVSSMRPAVVIGNQVCYFRLLVMML